MDVYRISDILIAVWKVSQPHRSLPQGQGRLDAALKTAIDNGAFPEEFKELTFTRTRLGIYCPELIEMFDFASMTMAISTPNPTFLEATISISRAATEAILGQHSIPLEAAVAWGQMLADALDAGAPEPR